MALFNAPLAIGLGVVLASAAVGPTSYAASAAPPTCHGQAATITASTGTFPDLIGTDGPDVIVIDKYVFGVDAGAGDDLICRTVAGPTSIDAGPGDDTVDQGTETNGAVVTLGVGADVLTGTYGGHVFAGTGPDWNGNPVPAVDTERDNITIGTGGGTVVSGTPDAPNADVVGFAGGDSTLQWSGNQAPGGSIDFGDGRNRLILAITTPQPVPWKVSAVSRSIKVGGQVAVQWSGVVNDYAVGEQSAQPSELKVDGSNADESVVVTSRAYLHLRGGDDEIVLPYGYEPPASVFSAGGGRDRLVSGNTDSDSNIRGHEEVRVDLDEHRLVFGSGAEAPVTIVNGIEDLSVGATRVRVHGDEKANEVFTTGCDIRVSGAAGNDVLHGSGGGTHGCPLLLSRLLGGSGRDELIGTGQDDILLGGKGHDRADGRKGTDRCRAEVTKSCET
jgi:Ca2+-binding RTX toxin-like protein